jgi:hypothetical protein
VRGKRGKVPRPALRVSMGFAHNLDADWRHFPANKIIGGQFFLHVDMATILSMPVLCFSFIDRLNVAARNLDTVRIDPAIVVEFSKLISEGHPDSGEVAELFARYDMKVGGRSLKAEDSLERVSTDTVSV